MNDRGDRKMITEGFAKKGGVNAEKTKIPTRPAPPKPMVAQPSPPKKQP